MSYDLRALRAAEFPAATRRGVTYLNNASTGPLPARTLAAVNAFNAMRAEPQVITLEHQFGTAARARELVARLINAKVEEVALMVNTTYGINLAARALRLRAGDVVVAPAREFPANVYPWMALEKDGVRFEMIPASGDLVDEAALLRALDRPNVRVLAVSWVSFATGYRVDLATLGRACRERGIYFVVDAIQGLGPLTLDVREVPIDILACGAQKWLLSPWGTGFVYVRDELVRALEPHDVGWMAMKASEDFTKLLDYDFTYFDDARRFEVVTLPFQDIAGFVASLELLHELGPRDIESHVTRLVTMAVEWALSRGDVCLVTPREHAKRGGIVSIQPRDPVAASERLTRAGVAHSLREGGIRLSPYCYNTADDVERALELMGG